MLINGIKVEHFIVSLYNKVSVIRKSIHENNVTVFDNTWIQIPRENIKK